MPEEILLKYAGSSVSKRKDKSGNLIEVYKVKLQGSQEIGGKHYTLTISDGDDSLLDEYDESCELPIILGKSSQTKLVE